MKIKIQAFLAQDSFAAFARVAAWLVGPQHSNMASCRRQARGWSSSAAETHPTTARRRPVPAPANAF